MAYFTAADLKGDNMYSCDKCKKLSDGVKYSKLLALPEVVCSFIFLQIKLEHHFFNESLSRNRSDVGASTV
jgi:ubiquitin carboxyl-terminal hydrolase 20/33